MCAHLYTIRRAREKRIKSIFVSIYTYFHATLSRATLKVCQHIVVVVNKKSILDTHVLKTTKSFKMVRTDVCICTWILSDWFFTLFLYVWWVDGLDDIRMTFNGPNLTNPSKTSSKNKWIPSIQPPKKAKAPREEQTVSLGPQVAEGELVFGVAHIYASFNDTFVHVTDLSGRETISRVTGAYSWEA